MLLQYDLNKWRVSKLTKLDNLYVNSASTRLLQRYNIDFVEYKNQIILDNFCIHLRACDAESSYNCPSPITVSKIIKWDCIFNCCYDCPGMNSPYL